MDQGPLARLPHNVIAIAGAIAALYRQPPPSISTNHILFTNYQFLYGREFVAFARAALADPKYAAMTALLPGNIVITDPERIFRCLPSNRKCRPIQPARGWAGGI